MRSHVPIVAWITIVLNGLWILFGAFLLLMLVGIGGLAAVAGGHEALPALPILGTIGTLLGTFFAALGIPGVIIGIGLLNHAPWARIAGIVFSVISLVNFPIGTAIGVYSLIVLTDAETVAAFDQPRY